MTLLQIFIRAEFGDRIFEATTGSPGAVAKLDTCDAGEHRATSSLGANEEATNDGTAFATGHDCLRLVRRPRRDGAAVCDGADAAAAQASGARPAGEIGRASCRERVWMSGAGGSVGKG